MKLSPQLRVWIADFCDSDDFKNLKKILEDERRVLAKKCLTLPKDRLEFTQGQAYGYLRIYKDMLEVYHQEHKKDG